MSTGSIAARSVSPSPAQVVPALVGERWAPLLQGHLKRLRAAYDHPNRRLHFDTLLTALLLAFYDPAARSLRIIEDASTGEHWRKLLPVEKVCRSTLADALGKLSPHHLLPLIKELQRQLPGLDRQDQDLAGLLRRIIAADGSIFTVPADVAWALSLTRSNGKPGKQVRLNLQLDVLRFVPEALSVSGQEEGLESAAFADELVPEVIYLCDRGFVDFAFIHAVFAKGSNLVVRLKKDVIFKPLEPRPLTPDDQAAGVRSDSLGHLPGTRNSPGFGDKVLREVVVWDYRNNKPVRLLTDLLDAPAALIGKLYRHRWLIETFFRWLKCVANVEHLYSQSKQGITLEFYVAVIAVLLAYLETGRRPSKYASCCLGWVASGQMTLEQMLQVLQRREDQYQLEQKRLKRKAASKNHP